MVDSILEYWTGLSRELASKFNVEQFDTSSAWWSWDNFGDDIRGLRNKHGIGEESIDVLGLRVDLETGETYDTIKETTAKTSKIIPHLYYYSKAKDDGIAGEWVKFNSLQGSFACRYSYNEDTLKALTSAFVEKREKLFEALERIGGKRVDYGDAAFEISFLPKVKVLVVFEDEDEEFPASVRMLFDKNSILYLPHEMLGDIGWLLASRALSAL
ncbi:MAG: DUF3786 domain-containing protein [Candidatus Thorarchaeota archaeon]